MKPTDILPDNQDVVEKDGRSIRKGSVAAFIANVQLLEAGNLTAQEEVKTIADMMELIPILRDFGFFDVFAIRSEKIRNMIDNQWPIT